MTTSTAPRLPVVELLHEPDPAQPANTFTQPGPFGSITITQFACLHCRRWFSNRSNNRCAVRAPEPTPLDLDLMDYRPGRRGGQERWGAVSLDREWAFIREESAGTHWHIEHLPTERILTFAATKIATARKMTADGTARAMLDQRSPA
jgi:hypothetical protein